MNNQSNDTMYNFATNKRHKLRFVLIAGLLLSLFATYIISSRLTALMALRWFVRQTHIPLEIKSVSWHVNWRNLKQGKINTLYLEANVKPSGFWFIIDGPVEFSQKEKKWNIKLHPRIKTAFLPPVDGDIEIEISPDKNISGRAFIKTKKIHYERSQLRAIEFDEIYLNAVFEYLLQKENLSIISDVEIKNIQLLWDGVFFEKNKLHAKANLNIIPEKITIHELHFIEPYLAKIKGHLSKELLNIKGQGEFDLATVKKDIEQILNERIPTSIKRLSLTGKAIYNFTLIDQKLNSRITLLKPVINNFSLNPITLNFSRLREGDFILDIPSLIQLPLADSIVKLNNIKFSTKQKKTSGSFSLESGPLVISKIQPHLCIAPTRPIPGYVRLHFPKITFVEDKFLTDGHIEGSIFGGNLTVRNIKLDASASNRVFLDLDLTKVDLEPLGTWLRFGQVQGLLDIIFHDAELAITSLGTVPLNYNFIIHGYSAPHKQLHFSVEALDNLMGMMGVKNAAQNPLAAVALSVWYWFGSKLSFLNNLDYFGFNAKNLVGYTTLSTFDPPHSKNHYLIYGTSFKMPIKSTTAQTIYPIVMKTEDFQGWLWGRMAWLKSRQEKTDAQKSSEQNCTPLW